MRQKKLMLGEIRQSISVVAGSVHHQVVEHANSVRWPREGGADR